MTKSLVIACVLLLACTACAPKKIIEPGVTPEGHAVTAEDERYGYQVAAELSRQFPLSNSTSDNDRVRRVVQRITGATGRAHDPWKVYVFESSTFKNAAATRGNFVFVWTGLLDFTRSDAELAAVVSHEIGHVLAGHTDSDPLEEAQSIMSGIAGRIGASAAGNSLGPAAGIAGMVIEEGLKALLVNPGLQQKEYEADQIGLFLMADAGYNPESAISFWTRAAKDPDLSGAPIQALSSHPSSSARLERLERLMPEAEARYRGAAGSGAKARKSIRGIAPVFERPSISGTIVAEIPSASNVTVRECSRGWCALVTPVPGYLRESDLEREF